MAGLWGFLFVTIRGAIGMLACVGMGFSVVFRNENWVVCDKAHGVLTTPARDRTDPRPCLGLELQTSLRARIFPVHRLDFEVGGLTLFALHEKAHRESQLWFEDCLVGKVYEALSRPARAVEGVEEWRCRLVRGKKRAFVAAHGKESITRAALTERNEREWRWRLEPVTGRSHQLRFEMARHEAPILGDVLYGGEAVARPNWIALKAVGLDFSRVEEKRRLGLPAVLKIGPLEFSAGAGGLDVARVNS